jgi:hypothetical protein
MPHLDFISDIRQFALEELVLTAVCAHVVVSDSSDEHSNCFRKSNSPGVVEMTQPAAGKQQRTGPRPLE